MAGRKKLTLENTPGVWLRPDKRYGWEFSDRFADGSLFRRAGSRKTLEDAHASWLAAKGEFAGGPKCANERSVSQWSEYCLDSVFPTEGVSPRELDNRRASMRKWWVPRLGHMGLEFVTKQQVRAILKEMEIAGSSYDGRRNARNHLSAIYRAAQREFSGFTHNPADIEIGQRPTRNDAGQRITHKRTLTASEQDEVLKVAENDPYWIGVYLGLKLGLRRGEILALKWSHVDFERNVVHILDNVQRATGKGRQTRDTKTPAGERRIPMPDSVRNELKLRKDLTSSEYVMPSALGAAPEARKFSEAMKGFVTLAKLIGNVNRWGEPLPDPTLHDLRHTFAAEMANRHKVGPKTLQQLMGHERIETTLSYYVEASDEDMAEAMKQVA